MLLFNGYRYCFCCSCKHSLIANLILQKKKKKNIFRFLRNLNLWCLYRRWLMLPHHSDLKYTSLHLLQLWCISTQRRRDLWPNPSFTSFRGKTWFYIVSNHNPVKHLQSFLNLNVKCAVCVSTAEHLCLFSKVASSGSRSHLCHMKVWWVPKPFRAL